MRKLFKNVFVNVPAILGFALIGITAAACVKLGSNRTMEFFINAGDIAEDVWDKYSK